MTNVKKGFHEDKLDNKTLPDRVARRVEQEQENKQRF